jgi:hypothetical protein
LNTLALSIEEVKKENNCVKINKDSIKKIQDYANKIVDISNTIKFNDEWDD